METYLIIGSFTDLSPVGIITGTTNAESLLISLGAPFYGIRDQIDSVTQIPQFEVLSRHGVAGVGDVWMILPNAGVFGQRPELLQDGGAKVRFEKKRLNEANFCAEAIYEGMEEYFNRPINLDKVSARNSSITDNTLSGYRRIYANGIGFLVTVKSRNGAEAIRDVLLGSTFGKQFSARIDQVRVHRVSGDFDSVCTGDDHHRTPLRPLTPEQADQFGITHALPMWMGTGVNRKNSAQSWMWNGVLRPYFFGESEDEDVSRVLYADMREPADLPPRMSLPAIIIPAFTHLVENLFVSDRVEKYLRQHSNEWKDNQWSPGLCGVTQIPGLIRDTPNRDSFAHTMVGKYDGRGIAMLRDKVLQSAICLSKVAGPLVSLNASGHGLMNVPSKVPMNAASKSLIRSEIKVSRRMGDARPGLLREFHSIQEARVYANLNSNKIDRLMNDLRWSAGSLVFDNINRDYMDTRVYAEFDQLAVPVRREVISRWTRTKYRDAISPEGTNFVRRHLGRILPDQITVMAASVGDK